MSHDVLNRVQATTPHPFPLAIAECHALRVMSYNIRINHAEDRGGPHDWLVRRSMVAGLIAGYGVTLAGLQEADIGQWSDLSDALPHYTLEGFSAGLGGAQEENLILCYQRQRLELMESAVFSLSPTPGLPAKGWDAKYRRSCVYGKFRDRITGKRFAFFNTHFDHRGEVARQEGAHMLVALQNRLASDLPRIVVGDFNPFPDHGGYQLYTTIVNAASGLADIRDVAQEGCFGPDGSWLGWEYELTKSSNSEPGARLDHIFIGGAIDVTRCGVLTASVDQQGRLLPDFDGLRQGNRNYPSDHLPVIADISI